MAVAMGGMSLARGSARAARGAEGRRGRSRARAHAGKASSGKVTGKGAEMALGKGARAAAAAAVMLAGLPAVAAPEGVGWNIVAPTSDNLPALMVRSRAHAGPTPVPRESRRGASVPGPLRAFVSRRGTTGRRVPDPGRSAHAFSRARQVPLICLLLPACAMAQLFVYIEKYVRTESSPPARAGTLRARGPGVVAPRLRVAAKRMNARISSEDAPGRQTMAMRPGRQYKRGRTLRLASAGASRGPGGIAGSSFSFGCCTAAAASRSGGNTYAQ